jgi:sugar phosphate permease
MILESGVGRLRTRVDRLYYGWRLVPVSGMIMAIATTPMFHAMGLWFVALESSFGWSRTQLSLAFAFTRVEGGILGPLEGYLVDRLGTRRLVFIGMIVMGIGWLFFSQIRALWMFYLAYMIVALGQGLGGWLALTTMLNNWFSRRRATAMGWSSAISRLGTLLLIPAIAWAIDPEFDRLGWEFTTALLGIMILLVAFPLSRLVRNRPEDHGLLPDGDAPDEVESRDATRTSEGTTTTTAQVDFTLGQAVRTRAFWLIGFGHGFTSMLLIGLVAHLAPMMTDRGYSLPTAALVITAYTTMSMIFQAVGGMVGDRFPKHLAITVFVFIQAAAVILLVYGPSTLPVAYGFAVLFGIGFGGRSPLTTSIRGDYFGRKSFGKIMGVSQVPMNVLLLIAPIFAGVMRDWRGDYDIAFTVLAGCSAFGGVLFLFAKRPVAR